MNNNGYTIIVITCAVAVGVGVGMACGGWLGMAAGVATYILAPIHPGI